MKNNLKDYNKIYILDSKEKRDINIGEAIVAVIGLLTFLKYLL